MHGSETAFSMHHHTIDMNPICPIYTLRILIPGTFVIIGIVRGIASIVPLLAVS
jgi:hypothetical protein